MANPQLELALVPDWQRCEHSGFISLAGDAAAFYCDHCEREIFCYVPQSPAALGYVSAIWKDWAARFPHRYTVDTPDPNPEP